MKTNYNNINESANQVKNSEQARNQPQAVTDKDGRHCYAFVLYVGGEISRILAAGWWSTYNDAETTTSGMAVAAVAFKKTAAVVAYELQDNDVYELMTTRNAGSRDRLCFKIHRSRIESGKYIAPTLEEQKEYFSMDHDDCYTGAECMPVGWNEKKEVCDADYYRETLCASWWGGDDVPRLFEFCGLNLVCIRKSEYWDLTTDDGKGTQHDLTLDELADVLAQYYADDQKAKAARVA